MYVKLIRYLLSSRISAAIEQLLLLVLSTIPSDYCILPVDRVRYVFPECVTSWQLYPVTYLPV